MRPVRAILIDPFAKTVRGVVIDASDYREINRLIEAEHFDVRPVDGRDNAAYVDDEGIYRADQHYFAFGPWAQWPGKTLITGVDEVGETVDTTLDLERVRSAVRFYAVQPVFKTITSTEEPADILGRPGISIVQTAHFDPEGVEEKQ